MIGVSIAALIGYDIYAFSEGGYQATISYTIFSAAHIYPAIPFAFGFLCGHLVWGQG